MTIAAGALRDRVALVTGATKGIGRACAFALASAGATVIAVARSRDDVEALCNALRDRGATAFPAVCDVTDATSIAALGALVERTGRGLDILVNNAGGAPKFGLFSELDDEDWAAAFTLNVLSVVRLVRLFGPTLRRSNYGRIINIGSISATEPGRSNPHYCASKAALLNLGKSLAGEFAAERITVNTISAGPVESAAWDRLFDQRSADEARPAEDIAAEALAFERSKIPLGRIGSGDDVAALIAFLASDAGAWITGASFVVDGGKSRSIG